MGWAGRGKPINFTNEIKREDLGLDAANEFPTKLRVPVRCRQGFAVPKVAQEKEVTMTRMTNLLIYFSICRKSNYPIFLIGDKRGSHRFSPSLPGCLP